MTNRLIFRALILVGGVFHALTGQAVPACPLPAEVLQPDGTGIKLYLRGDEGFHWHESEDGYTVLKDQDSRSWVYADIGQDGDWTTTVFRVGRDSLPARFTKRMLPVRRLREGVEKKKRMLAASVENAQKRTATKGTLKNLVLLVQFPDLEFHFGKADFNRVLNETGYSVNGALGSVKDYYKEVSYGQLNMESVIAGPVTVSHGYAYYGENAANANYVKDMVAEALEKLEASGFDFSQCDVDKDGQIDGFDVIHAGYGAEYSGNSQDYIWSHQWNLRSPVTYDGVRIWAYHTESELYGWTSSSTYEITHIGVICHETGHFLGLPDLYDTDGSSSGLGKFCLMSSGSWNGPGGNGASPAHMSAWCKVFLNWVAADTIMASGNYSLSRVEDSGQVYKLCGNFSSEKEYFLLENRQGFGFDAYLPGTTRGMLIWHIDDRMGNNDNESHYWVDLEEASGTQHLVSEKGVSGDDADYFRSSTKTSFSSSTTPNSKSYSGETLGIDISQIGASGATMSFYVTSSLTPSVEPPTAPTSISVSTWGPDNANTSYIKISWSGASGATRYDIYRSTSSTSRPSSPFATNVTSPYYDYKTSSELVPGRKYYYWVSAVNSAGTAYSSSDWGNILVTLSLGQSTASASAAGGPVSVPVTANTSWSATKDANWITFSNSSGSGNGTLSFTVGANPGTTALTGTITITAASGESYSVTKTITVTQEAAKTSPSNAFSAAPEITGYRGSFSGSNRGATRENYEPSHAGDSSATSSIWWKWPASHNGMVQIDTIGSSIDTVLAVYTGSSLSSLTPVAQNDDIDFVRGEFASRVEFYAIKGTTYRIAVAGVSGAGGDIVLNLQQFPEGQTTISKANVSANGKMQFSFKAQAGKTYYVQRATSLANGGNWTTVQTIKPTATTVQSVEAAIDTSKQSGFYRILTAE